MIFGLRNVRRMLDNLSISIDAKRVKEIESVLAIGSEQSVSTEWEVAIGYALSQIGKLKDFDSTGGSNPDFIWTSELQSIVVEVTSISDLSLHSQNPVEDFSAELGRISRKEGLIKFGSLNFELGSKENSSAAVLAMPPKKEFSTFFRSVDFKYFLKDIKLTPDAVHVFEFNNYGASSKISYLPGQRYASGNYRNYTTPNHYKHSPVFNALKKKEEQIRKSNTLLPAILFICDNDCAAMRTSWSRGSGSIGMRDIVGLFLNGQKSQRVGDFILQQGVPAQGSRIQAVVWVSVYSEANVFSPIKTKLKAGIEYATYACDFIKSPEFLASINLALENLPVPKITPNNASRKFKYPKFYGDYQMSGNKIKFSALTLQKLLAGEIPFSDFERDHLELVAQIRRLNDSGSMLNKAEVEFCYSEDDDLISFSFDGINPNRLFKKPT